MASNETVAVLVPAERWALPCAQSGARGVGVRAWNRSREQAEPLSKDGAEVFSAAQAVTGADLILTNADHGDEDLSATYLISAPSGASA